MADHNDRSVLGLLVVPDIGQDTLPAHRIQTGSGLVENQHVRLHGDHAGNGHPALLTAGQLKGRFLQVFLGNAHESGSPAYPLVDLLFGQSHVLGAEGDVQIGGLLKQLVLRILEHQAHPESGLPGELLIAPDIPAVQENLSGRGLQKAVEMLNQGGFSGACMADDPDKLSPVHGQIDVLNGITLEGRTGSISVRQVSSL